MNRRPWACGAVQACLVCWPLYRDGATPVVTDRLGRALDTRPTSMVDRGQLCQVLLTKPLTLPAMWQ